MATPIKILFIEDSEDDTELTVRALRQAGFEPDYRRVDTPAALQAALDAGPWDLFITDYTMPELNGLEALRIVRQWESDTPFIIVSGSIGEHIAVEAMRSGAHDYIMKSHPARLIPAIRREIKEAELRREHREAEQRIRFLAYYDPLTELPNRTRFLAELEDCVANGEQNGEPAALLCFDLSHFREINDTLGHGNGDLLLREAASRLVQVMRPSDTAARLGGDDFALVLYPADAQHANRIAEQLHARMLEPFEVAGLPLEVGAKIGMALYPQHGRSARELLQHADVALSLAMRGTHGLAVYDPRSDPSNPGRLRLMSDLRAALQTRQLQAHFQPKICMQSRRLTGVEALVRWTHPERGAIPPDEFVPLAETTGMIGPLTLHMLETCMEQAYRWHQRGMRVPIAINLSVKDLLDESLTKKVEALLNGRTLTPDLLEFEITETVLMENPERALDILAALNALGIKLAIDDFGTGYSSLAYIKKLPVNAVKIDKSFVVDMTQNKDAALIVRTIIDLAHNLGMRVVAEGVETQATWDQLAAYGCDEAQGYFISHPLPAGQFEQWAGTSDPWTGA